MFYSRFPAPSQVQSAEKELDKEQKAFEVVANSGGSAAFLLGENYKQVEVTKTPLPSEGSALSLFSR